MRKKRFSMNLGSRFFAARGGKISAEGACGGKIADFLVQNIQKNVVKKAKDSLYFSVLMC